MSKYVVLYVIVFFLDGEVEKEKEQMKEEKNRAKLWLFSGLKFETLFLG